RSLFHQLTGGIHYSNQLARLSQSPRPISPQGVRRAPHFEATGDSLHLALVLRESRFGELAITLTDSTQRKETQEPSNGRSHVQPAPALPAQSRWKPCDAGGSARRSGPCQSSTT